MKHTTHKVQRRTRIAHAIALLLIGTITSCLQLPTSSQAQTVTTNITASGLGTQVQPPSNGVYNITGGQRVGTNLFHGLGQINVGIGDVANFQNTAVGGAFPSTTNILAGITGGQPSQIYGTVRTTDFGNANLFLLNPRGVIFGPTAALDIGATSVPGTPRGTGSFYASTADYLRLSDGISDGYFYADSLHTNVLTTSPVVAFGFLTLEPGMSRGTISVQGSTLSVAAGQTIGLIGGGIEIQSGAVDGATQSARLSAPNGKIQLASAASPGEFDATTLQPLPNVDSAAFTSFGSMTLASGSSIGVSGASTVSIRGGQFVLSVNDTVLSTSELPGGQDLIALSRGSSTISSTAGAESGPNVEVRAGTIQLDGASITGQTLGERAGGSITLDGQSINLTNGAQIVSSSAHTGSGGPIAITARDSVTIFGYDAEGTLPGVATLFFNPSTGTPLVASGVYTVNSGLTGDPNLGKGGNLVVTAPVVTLDNGATLASLTAGDGAGGNISLSSQAITMTNGSLILSNTGQNLSSFEMRGSGKGGDIELTASESLLVSGTNFDLFALTTIQSQTSNTGSGGNITVSAPNITVDGGGQIVTATAGPVTGGSISVTATNQLSISGFVEEFALNSGIKSYASSEGNSGPIGITAGSVEIADRGAVSTVNDSSSRSGDLNLQAENITLTDGGWIGTLAGSGGTGKVTLTATDTLSVSGQIPGAIDFGITNRTSLGSNGANNGIDIHANKILLTDNGQILSETDALNGGTINIQADAAVTMQTGSIIRNRRGSLEFGSINMSAPSISMNNASIESRTFGNQNAGQIGISATNGDLSMSNGSHILTSTTQLSGNAGPIVATAADSILLSGGSTIESSSSGPASGNGGSLAATAGNLISLTGTGTGLFSSTGTAGNGGTVTVAANQVQVTDGAVISAKSTGAGAAGSVTVEGTSSPAQSIQINGPGSGLFTETQGTGTGGNITAFANQVTLGNGATISSRTTGSGNAGNILVKAHELRMSGGAKITAASTGSGNAGTVTIRGVTSPANSVLIEGAGTGLFTNTEDKGRGGDIAIDTTTLTMQNGGMISAATSGTDALASGGNITITASQSIDLRSNASVSASSTGPADAGNITVNAGNRFEARNSSVTTRSEHAGGGNIEINALDQIRLVNSQVNASAFINGGNISIDPNLVILQNSRILAQAILGNGGNITIFTPLFLADSTSLVSASSQFGLNGTVTIQSPTSNLSGSLGTLSSKPRQAQSLLTQRCAALANGQASSFVVAGREQLPADPGGWLSSPLAFASLGESLDAADAVASIPPVMAMAIEDTDRVSLRRLTPAGFLIANFADSEATGCHS